MIKTGVFGADFQETNLMNRLQETGKTLLCGIYDPDPDKTVKAANHFSVNAYTLAGELIDNADAICFASPGKKEYEIIKPAIRKSRHIFIENPVYLTDEELLALIKMSSEANVKVQAGFKERFHPALKSSVDFISNPMFIESHRLSEFGKKGSEISVVLESMINDIDIILGIVKSNIKKISASGISVISDQTDIANARIEFDNGCVANLTASRISLNKMQKIRFCQSNAYISVDLLNPEVKIASVKEVYEGNPGNPLFFDLGEKGKKEITINSPDIPVSDPLSGLLNYFFDNIHFESPNGNSAERSYTALNVAYQIMEKIKLTSN